MNLVAVISKYILTISKTKAIAEKKEALDQAASVPPSIPSTPTPSAMPATPAPKEAKEGVPLTESKSKLASIVDLSMPIIPEQYIKSVISVLTEGVCSSKTFQYTLSVVNNIASLGDNRMLILNELLECTQNLGNLLLQELNQLQQLLPVTSQPSDIQSLINEIFSPATSVQARLLRVLKTMDYMASKADQIEKDTKGENVASSEFSLVPTYDKLNFKSVWTTLGDILNIIKDKDDLIHICTALLPCIEACMVISKPYVMRKANMRASRYSMDLDTNDAQFLAFTDGD